MMLSPECWVVSEQPPDDKCLPVSDLAAAPPLEQEDTADEHRLVGVGDWLLSLMLGSKGRGMLDLRPSRNPYGMLRAVKL